MPNLPTHMDIASCAAAQLENPVIEANLGHFILGSISPDVEKSYQKSREQFHFAPLSFGSVGDGVIGLFEKHPYLESRVSDQTRAFVAGYVSHLILDEVWIVEMFRPWFGNSAVFEDRALGLVYDRAMQLELDRHVHSTIGSVVSLLEQATAPVDVNFIPDDTLNDWRCFVVKLVGAGFTWDRLRFMARRIAAGDESHPAHGLAEEFIAELPVSIETLFEYVSRDKITEFKNRSLELVTSAVGDYLS